MMTNKPGKVVSVLLAGLILLGSCNDDEAPNGGEPPTMPPQSSMEPDFSYFNDEGNTGGRVDVINNWLYAAANVTVYSAILGGALVVPVSAYKLALEQDAQYNSELGLWVWDYEMNVGSVGTFSVSLTAETKDSEVIWTGKITKDGVFEDFVWFEGTSEISGESGKWTLYESYTNPVPWLSAEWTKSEVEGKANVTFTVEKEGSSMGSSIGYEASSTGDFNRHVTIVDTHADNTIIMVDWNSETKVGRVKNAAHFQDEVYHCWDGDFQDTTCE